MPPKLPHETIRRIQSELERRRIAALDEDAKREWQDKCRGSLLDFVSHTLPTYRASAHHRLICEKLEAVERGECRRLMIFTPPRHGKSELSSRRFPAWYVGRNPTREFISASYGADLASDFGRDVRNIVASAEFAEVFPGVRLAPDSTAKNRWHTNQRGSYVAAGVGTAITGRGADILNIDDPVKDRKEAESDIVRNDVWAWYTSTAYTRLMPNAAIVLTMTRWHEDDLAGRLLAAAGAGGDQWEVIDLPALAESDTDALHRRQGEALWTERYDAEALTKIRAAIGERDFSALYQQHPRPPEGALFKPHLIEALKAAPVCGSVVRSWDLAATKKLGTNDPDWTVGLKLGRTREGRYIVLDVVRLRAGPDEVEAAIVNTASLDGRGVQIRLSEDPGQAGKQQVLYLTRKLNGYIVSSQRETGDKATRAGPIASQVNVGNVSMVEASWNMAFRDELGAFPSGTHDDQVDGLSGAFEVVGLGRSPMQIASSVLEHFGAR